METQNPSKGQHAQQLAAHSQGSRWLGRAYDSEAVVLATNYAPGWFSRPVVRHNDGTLRRATPRDCRLGGGGAPHLCGGVCPLLGGVVAPPVTPPLCLGDVKPWLCCWRCSGSGRRLACGPFHCLLFFGSHPAIFSR